MERGKLIHEACSHLIGCINLEKECKCSEEVLRVLDDPKMDEKFSWLYDFCCAQGREFYGSEVSCYQAKTSKRMICDILLKEKKGTLTLIELKTGLLSSRYRYTKVTCRRSDQKGKKRIKVVDKYGTQVKQNVAFWNSSPDNGPKITQSFIFYFDYGFYEKVRTRTPKFGC